MFIYRVETTISKEKTISLKDLPFAVGYKVKVLVRRCKHERKNHRRYPLRGQPVRYIKPFDSVAEDEWGILR